MVKQIVNVSKTTLIYFQPVKKSDLTIFSLNYQRIFRTVFLIPPPFPRNPNQVLLYLQHLKNRDLHFHALLILNSLDHTGRIRAKNKIRAKTEDEAKAGV